MDENSEFFTANSSEKSTFFSAESSSSNINSVEWTDLDLKIVLKLRSFHSCRFWTREVVIRPIRQSSGIFRSGRLHGVLGPSGSGKTTLLNVLAGRASKKNLHISGEISFSGIRVDPASERKLISYVLSEEALHGVLTPFEATRVSLRLRRPDFSEPEIRGKVDVLLESLGLSNCKETFIGSELVKGISSGEKKRTSIAVELVHEPNICFLDEPTTGLDSFTAFKLVGKLREIARTSDRCVVATIHQPATETFGLFDDVTFLAKGWVVYQGPVDEIKAYFENLGYRPPPKFNLADYIMLVLQRANAQELERLVQAWEPRANDIKTEIAEFRESAKNRKLPTDQLIQPPVGMQTKELLRRERMLLFRDPRLLSMRFLVPVLLALFTSAVLWQQGKTGITQAHVAAVTNVAIGTMMPVAQPVIISFPLERTIFIREYTAGMYSVLAFFFCKVIVDLPATFLICMLILVIDYFMTGLVGSYLLIFLGVFLNAVAASALAFAIGTFAGSPQTAMEFSGPFFIFQFLFAGLWIRYDAIPVVLRWIGWIVPLKYGISIMYIGEFPGVPGYQALFAANNVNESLLALYISVLVVLIVAIRGCSILGLKRASRKTVF